MSDPRRAQERITAALALKVEGRAVGITKDISPTGIFFETDIDEIADGSPIHFTLDFDSPSGKLRMECLGEVIRTEKTNGKIGVAARIVESRLERCEEETTSRVN